MIIIITLKDINTAIVSQIKEGLSNTTYSTVDFASTDIKEIVVRPSFYIEFADNKTGRFNNSNKERTLNTKVYYFPTDKYKYKIELMEVQGYLEDIFLEYLKVTDDFYIDINEIDFDITSGVLICTISLYTIEDISNEPFTNTPQDTVNDNTENIEELEIN